MENRTVLIDICGTLFDSNTTLDFLDFLLCSRSYRLPAADGAEPAVARIQPRLPPPHGPRSDAEMLAPPAGLHAAGAGDGRRSLLRKRASPPGSARACRRSSPSEGRRLRTLPGLRHLDDHRPHRGPALGNRPLPLPSELDYDGDPLHGRLRRDPAGPQARILKEAGILPPSP